MKEYDVTIEAKVRKNIRVEGETEQEAIKLAHELFTVANTDEAEDYEQNDIGWELIGEVKEEIPEINYSVKQTPFDKSLYEICINGEHAGYYTLLSNEIVLTISKTPVSVLNGIAAEIQKITA
ncbi:MAG: hypothetical protein WC119_00705 [Synergistaceae bacterium]